jgi:hypothetical protein
MSSRVSIPLIACAAVAGYLIGGRAVTAQDFAWPVRIGETATILFTPDWSRDCRVEEMRGTFVRCRNSAGVNGEYWLNVAVAGAVKKAAPGHRSQ